MSLPFTNMNRTEIRAYFIQLQKDVQEQVKNGKSIDDILDESQELREVENWIPQEEYGILILTLLNNFKSKSIMKILVDSVIKTRAGN